MSTDREDELVNAIKMFLASNAGCVDYVYWLKELGRLVYAPASAAITVKDVPVGSWFQFNGMTMQLSKFAVPFAGKFSFAGKTSNEILYMFEGNEKVTLVSSS